MDMLRRSIRNELEDLTHALQSQGFPFSGEPVDAEARSEVARRRLIEATGQAPPELIEWFLWRDRIYRQGHNIYSPFFGGYYAYPVEQLTASVRPSIHYYVGPWVEIVTDELRILSYNVSDGSVHRHYTKSHEVDRIDSTLGELVSTFTKLIGTEMTWDETSNTWKPLRDWRETDPVDMRKVGYEY